LGIFRAVYLWLRRNFVQDIMFRVSDAHLEYVLKQFEKGRTCTKTTLEIGLMFETKQDWLSAKLEEMEIKLREGDITEEKFEEFKEFRHQTLEKMVINPWERFNLDTYKSFTHLLSLYVVLFGKIIVSYSHLSCYFFMYLSTIHNGGVIYMVYPALLFGVALLEEDRPGKNFWFFVVFYTCVVLFLQFTA
jgi:hypothetical protein